MKPIFHKLIFLTSGWIGLQGAPLQAQIDQQTASLQFRQTISLSPLQNPRDPLPDSISRRPVWRPFIAPVVLMGGGLLTKGALSRSAQHQTDLRFPGFESHVDDFLQYAPTVAVLGLGIAGVKGEHGLKDQLFLNVLSQGLAQAITRGLKHFVPYQRPDGSGDDSFPSGHTSMAFTGATLLSREYGKRSIFYSIGGYGIAAAVGSMRIMNNRHWLSDVLFGAGVGIGATETVYALYPWLQRKVFKSQRSALIPFYNGSSGGIYWAVVF